MAREDMAKEAVSKAAYPEDTTSKLRASKNSREEAGSKTDPPRLAEGAESKENKV